MSDLDEMYNTTDHMKGAKTTPCNIIRDAPDMPMTPQIYESPEEWVEHVEAMMDEVKRERDQLKARLWTIKQVAIHNNEGNCIIPSDLIL